ncbi:MAG: DEAD/DEAH box helicase [Nitrosomonadaceae bacterium]
MILRYYQEKAITQLRPHRRPLLVMPTGSGKTVVFVEIAKLAVAKGNSVMIVCDRKELVEQAVNKLQAIGIEPGILMAGTKLMPGVLVTVASVQTIMRRKISPPDVLIIDEAHKKTFSKLLAAWDGKCKIIIGCTATPVRSGTKDQLIDQYTAIIEPVTIKQLLADKHLVPCRSFGAPLDTSSLQVKGGEFDPHAMYKMFDKAPMYSGVVNKYVELTPGTKAIVFCINVAHSKATADTFRSYGVKVAHLDGNTPKKEREHILHQFKLGVVRVLCNCDLYTTGFDEPSIETVIINRATKSLPLFLQMAGRGSRPFPNKHHFNLIDMGNNVFTHGFWQQERDYTLDRVREKGAGVAPVKECQSCQAIVHASAAICKYCGNEFPKTARQLEEAEFVQLKESMGGNDLRNRIFNRPDLLTVKELEVYRAGMDYKLGWLIRKIINRPGGLEELAQMKGYSNGWVFSTRKRYGNG